jgi:hypothetical protein
LILPELLIAEDIDPEEVKGLSNGFVDLADKLDDRCRGLDPWHSFYLKKRFLRKTPAKRSDLEIGFSRDMVHSRIEGFDGRMDRHLDANKNTDPKGNPHNREECSHFMEMEMTESDLFK